MSEKVKMVTTVVVNRKKGILFLELGVSALSTGAPVLVLSEEYAFSTAGAELVCALDGVSAYLVIIFCSHCLTL